MAQNNQNQGNWLLQVARVFRTQWRLTMRDIGVLLFFLALPYAYPVVYTLIYNPEVVTDLPVAVVDNSRTEASRTLVRDASASPAISIYGYCSDIQEAKDLFANNKVFAIMEIPEDYARKIGRGEQATVPMYMEMGLLLRYRALVSALTNLQLKVASDITSTRLSTMGAEALGVSGGMPFKTHNSFLGDKTQGFGSFVMPGMFMLILQQSILLGICFLTGTANERRRRNGGIDPLQPNASPSAHVWGLSLMVFILYIPAVIYMVKIMPDMFFLPNWGDMRFALLFAVPFILASIMFGQCVAGLCTERESPFLIVVFTSVIFLFLSGLTWPRYAMAPFWQMLGDCVPATWAVEGFIRINSNSATLYENAGPFWWLWGLCIVYYCGALLLAKIRKRPALKATPQKI